MSRRPPGDRNTYTTDLASAQAPKKPQCWEHGCEGRTFGTFSNLLRHQREKSGTSAKSTCHRCGAEFTRKTARDGHLAHDRCGKVLARDEGNLGDPKMVLPHVEPRQAESLNEPFIKRSWQISGEAEVEASRERSLEKVSKRPKLHGAFNESSSEGLFGNQFHVPNAHSSRDQATKRRNKLDFHRTSVACSKSLELLPVYELTL